MPEIKRVLIANRGEIAIRIAATCRALGVEVVTLYTEREKDLPHVVAGDFSFSLGNGDLASTYLDISRIIEIAKAARVDAIHPGYGFLSENALFSKACKDAGIVFIGPEHESIVTMGDKIAARAAAEAAGVPVVPGYSGEDQSLEFLKEKAEEIGYPVMIKASAGGGGKGMRIVASPGDFAAAFGEAKAESLGAFGDEQVFLEKYIESPRHIEVQVFSDSHGNHLHLFERECSIQRRHQKIIEETPSTALDAAAREKVTSAAVALTKSLNYLNAGTVEFIMALDGSVFFLEMNTRLQVEHPVTEKITGLDLVALQILVASGKPLPFAQEDIQSNGHAIEARIYAEDPARGHLPVIGTLQNLGNSVLPNVRLDTGYINGSVVTADFDPMLAKLIVWAENRELASALMKKALSDFIFLGITSNRRYLQKIMDHPAFVEGKTYTNFVDMYHEELLDGELSEEAQAVAVAALLFSSTGAAVKKGTGQENIATGPWDNGTLGGLRVV